MNNNDPTFSDLRANISDHMSLMFEQDGFSPLVGKIFALLLFAPSPLSLQEMAELLGVTKAAVSVQVRTLVKHAMCHKLPTSSDRKDFYYIADDFSMIAVRSVTLKMSAILGLIQKTLSHYDSIKQIAENEQTSHDASKQRFIEMKALYEMFMDRLSGLEEEWGARRLQLMKEQAAEQARMNGNG